MNAAQRIWTEYLTEDVSVAEHDDGDVIIPDLPEDETDHEFVEERVKILFDNARHGEEILHELESFDGKSFTLRSHDGRTVKVQYELEGE